MTNLPYEERIKNRDNDWYYNKCIRQYHFIIKAEGANQRYKEEIARLNNCINKIQDIINEYDFSIKEEWYNEPENWELDENCYAPSYIDLHKICLILKELKEEGKFQEIPLFEGTMEQLDNLTILKEEGK